MLEFLLGSWLGLAIADAAAKAAAAAAAAEAIAAAEATAAAATTMACATGVGALVALGLAAYGLHRAWSQPPTRPVPAATQRELMARAQHALPGYLACRYNFAVIGASGVGKSTIINGLRGIKNGQQGAAAVDEVEATAAAAPYPHPRSAHVCLWDLPGAGTTRIPTSQYYDNYCLALMDMVIIVFKDRITDLDVQLVKKAIENNQTFLLLRTVCDASLNEIVDRGSAPDMAAAAVQLREQVTRSVYTNLTAAGVNERDVPSVLLLSGTALQRNPATVYAHTITDDETGDERRDRTLTMMDERLVLEAIRLVVLERQQPVIAGN